MSVVGFSLSGCEGVACFSAIRICLSFLIFGFNMKKSFHTSLVPIHVIKSISIRVKSRSDRIKERYRHRYDKMLIQ